MHIANPIYDVVFKYLMEDSKIAKLMISSIIGEKIERLTFLPQEFVSDVEPAKRQPKKISHKRTLTVYRLDFSAKIKTKDGYRNVIIELQKAKFPTDIVRFRKYLAEQFANKENLQRVRIKGKMRRVGIPVISIYFLGHKLDHTTASVIKVSRQYTDLITNEPIPKKETFIESLTLDSYVIQVPYLTGNRRNDLEILLSIFDQSAYVDSEHHILNINPEDYPERYRSIIRRLQQATLDGEVKKKMEMEDGIINELEDMERDIELLEEENEQVKQKLDSVEQENELLRKRLEELEKQQEK